MSSKMLVLIVAIVLVATAAKSDGIGSFSQGLSIFGGIGSNGSGSAPPVLTNLRITNTGAFRITNTSANRAVFP